MSNKNIKVIVILYRLEFASAVRFYLKDHDIKKKGCKYFIPVWPRNKQNCIGGSKQALRCCHSHHQFLIIKLLAVIQKYLHLKHHMSRRRSILSWGNFLIGAKSPQYFLLGTEIGLVFTSFSAWAKLTKLWLNILSMKCSLVVSIYLILFLLKQVKIFVLLDHLIKIWQG